VRIMAEETYLSLYLAQCSGYPKETPKEEQKKEEYDFVCPNCGCRFLIGWAVDGCRTFLCPKCSPCHTKSHPFFEQVHRFPATIRFISPLPWPSPFISKLPDQFQYSDPKCCSMCWHRERLEPVGEISTTRGHWQCRLTAMIVEPDCRPGWCPQTAEAIQKRGEEMQMKWKQSEKEESDA